AAAGAFERVGAITLDSGENELRSAVIDPAGEFAYFGTNTLPGRLAGERLRPGEVVRRGERRDQGGSTQADRGRRTRGDDAIACGGSFAPQERG
ncbi:MAG: hypothetical protein ACRD2Z_04725, partial [Thermoanaerobaculia bacterium]